jgi:hypothetical protein
MSEPYRPQLLYVISIPPSLEDQLIDWLLDRAEPAGFSSSSISGHSSDPSHLSVAEKVSGKQHRLQFQVQIDAAQVEPFTAGLRAEFDGSDVHFWAIPLALSGSLHDASADKRDQPRPSTDGPLDTSARG